jgi:hypothetical protein
MRSVTNIKSISYLKRHAAQIAALKIIALGEKDRLQGKGLTVEESREQLRAARHLRE